MYYVKIGKEMMYKPSIVSESLYEVTNDNGNKLIFAAIINMIISNTYFPHMDIHMQNWISPCRLVNNQMDHIISRFPGKI